MILDMICKAILTIFVVVIALGFVTIATGLAVMFATDLVDNK